MTDKKLGDVDKQVIDLLLDKASMLNESNSGSGVFAAPVGDAVAERVRAAETLLRIVGQMPAEDPPKDLLGKTLERIRQSGRILAGSLDATRPQPHVGLGPDQA
jgi:hypothetical protein